MNKFILKKLKGEAAVQFVFPPEGLNGVSARLCAGHQGYSSEQGEAPPSPLVPPLLSQGEMRIK